MKIDNELLQKLERLSSLKISDEKREEVEGIGFFLEFVVDFFLNFCREVVESF